MKFFDKLEQFFSSAFSQISSSQSSSKMPDSAHVNPGTGLPMMQGGIDVGGNIFGASNMMHNSFTSGFTNHNPFNQFPQ